MMDFATKHDFGKLINKLEAYTTLESFNKMRINGEREYLDVCTKMAILVPTTQLEKEIENLKEFFAEKSKNNSQKRDCLKDKRDSIAMVEKL